MPKGSFARKATLLHAVAQHTNFENLKTKIAPGKDPVKVIANRVHSRAWHSETERLSEIGLPEAEICKRATLYAAMHVSRWKAKIAM